MSKAPSQIQGPFTARRGRSLAPLFQRLLPEPRRYWILVPLTGLGSGLLAVALAKFLDLVEYLCWGATEDILAAAQQLTEKSPTRVVATLSLAGAIAAVALRFLRREDDLQGTPALIEALAFRKGRIPALRTFCESIISITCVGAGASLGREGALLHAGAATASAAGSRLGLEDFHVRMLVACGAAGGIAAAYNVPVGASVFAMEVLLGSFALELIGPIIISSLISTTVARLLLGPLPAYTIPPYALASQWEILLNLVEGALLGLVSVGFIRLFSGLGRLFAWLRPVRGFRPVLAMSILALLGLWLPHLFGNGYDTVNLVLAPDAYISLPLLLTLPVMKIIVTGLCRAGGIPGGLFTPSLFIGALLGAAFGQSVESLFPPGSTAQPGAYALVGMGAILAGTLKAPFTATLMIFEMTQDYEIIVPLMSACAASAIVCNLFQGSSIFTEPLRRRGISLPGAFTPTWMRQPKVVSILQADVTAISPAARFKEVVDEFLLAPEGQDQIYVVSREGRYLGSISLHDIKRYFRETEHLDSVIAADIVNTQAPIVYVEDPLSVAIEILARTSTEHLPVLDAESTRKLLGTVSKRSLLAAYSLTNIARQAGLESNAQVPTPSPRSTGLAQRQKNG